MPSGRQGSIHLFRLAGVDLYLHWSWFLVAIYEIQGKDSRYTSIAWSVAEYLALFAIVLMHEFGHAMACRSVGGKAEQILLWPFGGVAYVSPPQRPGATLWSIAAGPLVNVALAPLLIGAVLIGRSLGWPRTVPDFYRFIVAVLVIDVGLFVFNMLPIYPLDGGQILRSLLWFVIGRARSLMVATVLGFVGAAGLIALAVWQRSIWTAAICVFIVLNCWSGLQRARVLLRLAKLPRRQGLACPGCHTAPPLGAFWNCGNCHQQFDTFETRGVCPHCSAAYPITMCLDCREQHPMSAWVPDAYAGQGVVSSSFQAR
ncbi:MAG TPA: site-2 protease family protein [Acidobacteriaceae bacterium]|jgi:Zn-dependent protease